MAVRRKAKEESAEPAEVVDMTEVTGESYEEEPDWDGSIEGGPADEATPSDDVVSVPKRRGRAPLTLPTLAGKFERAKAKCSRLETLDVEAERAKITGQMERLTERLAQLGGHEAAVKEAQEEFATAEREFQAALATFKG